MTDSSEQDAVVSRETRTVYLTGPFAHMSAVRREGAAKAELEFSVSFNGPATWVFLIVAVMTGFAEHSVLAGFGAFFTLIGLVTATDLAACMLAREWRRD